MARQVLRHPITKQDLDELAAKRRGTYEEPDWLYKANAATPLGWFCERGHHFMTTYHSIVINDWWCPTCQREENANSQVYVNGARTSAAQRIIADMIRGELNYPCGRRRVDVAIFIDDTKIAVEYDSWYYHGNRTGEDTKRDDELLGAGWKIIHIRANYLIPSLDIINAAIERVLAGSIIEIVLMKDWGRGPIFTP